MVVVVAAAAATATAVVVVVVVESLLPSLIVGLVVIFLYFLCLCNCA